MVYKYLSRAGQASYGFGSFYDSRDLDDISVVYVRYVYSKHGIYFLRGCTLLSHNVILFILGEKLLLRYKLLQLSIATLLK